MLRVSQANPMPKRDIDSNTRGALAGLENRSNVDLVVFGHEQDNFGGEEEVGFEYTEKDWVGNKKRVGALDANNSRVDSIVFGVDLDGFDQTPDEIDAELRAMPEFKGAAGLSSVKTRENQPLTKIDLDEPAPPTKFAALKTAGDVDEIVFGHDMGDGGNAYEEFNADPMWEGSSGVHSTSLNSDTFAEGRAMRRRGLTGGNASSKDLTFQVQQETPNWEESHEFDGAAGVSSKSTSRKANAKLGVSSDDGQFARYTVQMGHVIPKKERRIISQVFPGEHNDKGDGGEGQMPHLARFTFAPGSDGARAVDRRDFQGKAQGSSFFTDDTAGPEKRREVPRQYQKCAGLTSEALFYAKTNDMTRKAPMVPPGSHGPPTGAGEFGEGSGGGGGGGGGGGPARNPLEERAYEGSAGSSTKSLHREHRTKMVPQMRDTADDVILNRDMDHPQQRAQQQAFEMMQHGRAGQPTRHNDQMTFDARLYKSGERGNEDAVIAAQRAGAGRMVREQHGALQGASLLVKPKGEVAAVGASDAAAEVRAYSEAAGMSRAELAKHGGNMGGYVVSYDGELPQGPRERYDMSSTDVAVALNPSLPRPASAAPVAPRAKMGGAAGASMRMVNDRMQGLIADTVDSEFERRQQERDSSSKGVSDALTGGGYFERDTQVRYRPRQGEHAESYDIAMRDTVARQNLLQPDLNEGVAAEKVRDVNEQQRRLFMGGTPFGTDVAPRSMVTTAVANDRHIEHQKQRVLAEKGRAPERARMHHPWLCEPHEVTAVESREFIKAGNISEYQATHNQLTTVGQRGRAPFGVTAAGTAYTTSSQQAWSAENVGLVSPSSQDSMAGRIAQRRLQKGGSPRSAGGAGGGAMVPVGGRR